MQIKKHIPNLLTLLNLFCGCIALVFAADKHFALAFAFVALGIFFDFFDGFFARIFNTSGPLGLQLDSLADMVTSGVVPGATMFFLMKSAMKVEVFSIADPASLFCLSGFLITLGSGYRLARFNLDARQTHSFIGLPTPANCLFVLSLPLIAYDKSGSLIALEILLNPYVLLVISLFSAWIMNAEIPLFSLKIKEFNLSKYFLQIFFLTAALVLIVFFGYTGVALTIMFYILLSVARNALDKPSSGI